MQFDDSGSELVYGIIRQMPLILVYLGGLLLAIIFWRRHPLVSGLVLSGSALLLLAQIAHIYWEYVLIPNFEAENAVPEELDAIVLYGLPYVGAIGVGLIVLAAFVGRREGQRFRGMLDED